MILANELLFVMMPVYLFDGMVLTRYFFFFLKLLEWSQHECTFFFFFSLSCWNGFNISLLFFFSKLME